MPGIHTWAVPQDAVFMEADPDGCRVQVGIFDPALPGPENRMRILSDSFEKQAVSLVHKLMDSAGEWAFVDEIGYLECGSPAYMDAIRALFDRKRVIAAVRLQDIPFLQEIRKREDGFCVNLDEPFGSTGCVIMASGQSKRFGSNKLLADFRGEPMISRILSSTEGIFTRRTVVTRHPEIAAICRERGIDVVVHDLPYRSDTVRLGLETMGAADRCMFCAADQPLLRRESISSIVMAAVNDPFSIWRACFKERPGSPVLFPSWAFEKLMSLPQGKGGGFIAQMYPERVRTLSVANELELMDADDQETLEMLIGKSFEMQNEW